MTPHGTLAVLALAFSAALAASGEAPVADEETAALKDLEKVLQDLGADGGDHPNQRDEALTALARVREALDSWAGSAGYYDELLKNPGHERVAAQALSGALRACKAREMNVAALLQYCETAGAPAARPSAEAGRLLERTKKQLERDMESLRKQAERASPSIRTPQAPAARPEKPEKKGKKKDEPPPPPPADAAPLLFREIRPVLPDMQKLIVLIPEKKP